mmetsp:Transcript_32493/g.43210  ORF Transcript_32493/g.43210 Transcript_32493/m.43210 type:complete len:109 (-) Transcript_32493:154-480(-)
MKQATSQGMDASSVNSKTICIRGLEKQSSKSLAQQRTIEKASGIASVLIEQSFQRKSGITNPVAIANAYMSFSKGAKARAAHYGRQDAEDTSQVHEEMLDGIDTIADI